VVSLAFAEWQCYHLTMAYDIGEQPGIGDYCCTNCNWKVHLDDATDRLPPCGSCGAEQNTQYTSC